MKLNTKRTVLVGFAFLSICAFWQMYDNLVPKILTETFGIGESISGVIMASDNVLALFLLPLFGGLSDKCTSKLGRRRPFILVGTLAAVALMMALPVLTDSYHASPAAWKMVAFIIGLGLLLIAMGTYRSPAVALMPDVTPKPLRSKANAIINLMGALGGIIYLIITTFLYKTTSDVYVSYLPLFAIVGGIMLVALAIVMFCVNEPKLVAEQKQYEEAHPEDNLTTVTESGEVLPADVKRSLSFLLISIALWFIGYNGVTTWFSVYAAESWHMTLGQANTCLTIATAGAIVTYIPPVTSPPGWAAARPSASAPCCWPAPSPPPSATPWSPTSSPLCCMSCLSWWAWPGRLSMSTPCPWLLKCARAARWAGSRAFTTPSPCPPRSPPPSWRAGCWKTSATRLSSPMPPSSSSAPLSPWPL